MGQRWFAVIGWLCFLPLLTVGAYAQQYTRPAPGSLGGPPTNADLVTFDGASTSLTVELLNLTPYNIQFNHSPGVTWSITYTDEAEMQDDAQDRFTAKSFMFVPVAVPSLIPGAPAQDFLNPGDPGYDPSYQDTTIHPRSMVFAWDDHGGFVKDNWVIWTIKGVKYQTTDGAIHSQDVQLGLWMYRNKTAATLTSNYLPTLVDSLKKVFSALAIPIDTTNPLSWSEQYLVARELAAGPTEFAKENTQSNDGHKMWVASYVIPSSDSGCVTTGSGCEPTAMTHKDTGDAVYSNWKATDGGIAQAQLVVSVHLLRGQEAKLCGTSTGVTPSPCSLGSDPIVMITVMRASDFGIGAMAGDAPDLSLGKSTPTDAVRRFLLQVGAARIRQLLVKQGRPGLLILRSIIYGLDPAQQQVLRQMVRTMGSGRLPTHQERQLVHLIADELQARLHAAGLH